MLWAQPTKWGFIHAPPVSAPPDPARRLCRRYPYLTLYWLNEALLTDDKQALENLVDFPRVRADLKADVKSDVYAKPREAAEKRPILGTFGEGLAKLFAPSLVESTVDTMMTPDVILDNPTVVEHTKNGESFVDLIDYAFFASPTTFKLDLKDPEKPDCPALTAIMAFSGFKWRIGRVDLPPMESPVRGRQIRILASSAAVRV